MAHVIQELLAKSEITSRLEGSTPFTLALVSISVVSAIFIARLALRGSSKAVPKIHAELTPAITRDDGVIVEASPNQDILDRSRPGKIQCFDPSTSQRLGEVPAMTAAEVNVIAARAREAQVEWAKTSYAERRRVLTTMLDYMVEHMEDIARVCSRDSGKPKVEALLGEVMTTCEKIRTINAEGESWLKPEYRKPGPMMMHKTAYVEYRPLGVLGIIAPWNYPFHNLYNHVISGLFAGNAVVSKVSEYTSWSSYGYFSDIIRAALVTCGHSPDLVQVVTGLGEAGAALVACPEIDKIIFTGSPQVGRKVMEGAAPHLKPVILELGGKDPMVIMEDADIDGILPMALKGAFFNCGQNCCGVERFYVYEGVYDKFVNKVTKVVKDLRQGPPLGTDTIDCGAMVMPRQIEIIQELVDDAVANGARVLVGGERNPSFPKGNFYLPTVLVDVKNNMRIAQEEVFGPVMTIIKVPHNSDVMAAEMVNRSDYGLGSSVFSASQKRAQALGDKIRAGMTTINDFGVNYLVQALPFGGVKYSGFDRFAGPEGLRACCLMKSVVHDKASFLRTSIPKPLQYPVTSKAMPFGSGLLGMFYDRSIIGKIKSILKLIRAS